MNSGIYKITIDNVVYESYHDASKKLNIPIVTIRWRCLSNNPKFINYQFDKIILIDGDEL